jgi:hypothetical protein
MSKLLTYEEFLNESKKLNEAAPYTVDKYIKDSDGDEDWIGYANKIVSYMKLPANKIVWVTSDDDEDKKFEQVQAYWNDEADYENFTKEITGSESRSSAFYFAENVPMCQYEEQGIEAFMLPLDLYKTLGKD